MRTIAFLLGLLCGMVGRAQELYVFTEPASNMPTNALGIRLTNEGQFSPSFRSRTMGEVMVGLNKNLMFHVQGFFSDMDGSYRLEGGSVYAKYRFLSLDGEKSHWRAAVYARASTSKRPISMEDINLEGDNSGFQGGLILTKLVHKLALSATVGYSKARDGAEKQIAGSAVPNEIVNYSLSSGYLLLPFVYKNYHQPNFNAYVELLGKTNPANGHSYLDLAPAVQVILNSRTRIDLGYRFELGGNMDGRYLKNMYLVRLELNFFNALKHK
ncbi:MAG: hypothetical protein REI78_05665 [Pedobacter sp.]|nr:hypothetical protein [Pedobacter sp.]MDQ8052489.1 hypothetical protein [Pedobacter sp.]